MDKVLNEEVLDLLHQIKAINNLKDMEPMAFLADVLKRQIFSAKGKQTAAHNRAVEAARVEREMKAKLQALEDAKVNAKQLASFYAADKSYNHLDEMYPDEKSVELGYLLRAACEGLSRHIKAVDFSLSIASYCFSRDYLTEKQRTAVHNVFVKNTFKHLLDVE